MKTSAAILVQTGKPLVLDEILIPQLKPGQVLVEIARSGVCHTQVLECRGYRGLDPFTPHCLGHEGSGVVLETGPEVKKVKPGDRVILSWIKGSGANVPGSVYDWRGTRVNAGAITTFARYSVISENRLTVMPDGFSMVDAALLGCAVPTGVGAVLNTAGAKPGQSLAVFGAGGVGLCAVAGAAGAGCEPVIAVDVKADKLELAAMMGATNTIDASSSDPLQAIKSLCPGGLDFAIESSGRPQVMLQALASVRSQGGVAVVVGNARHGEMVCLDPRELNQGKQLRGTWGGDNQPDVDFPRYCEMIASGKLNLKPLVSRIYTLGEINQAIDDLEAGSVIRPIIDME